MTTRTHRRQSRISLATPTKVLPLLKAASTRMVPGEVLVALLDRKRRLYELLPVEADDADLPGLARTPAQW